MVQDQSMFLLLTRVEKLELLVKRVFRILVKHFMLRDKKWKQLVGQVIELVLV